LYSWGRAGFQDESPDKSLTSVTPLRINGPWKDDAIISASGGRAHTTIVSKKGNVYSWGNGHNFQLGHGDGKDQSMPKLVDALLGQQAVKISSGWGHNLILTAEGKVWSWGWNQDGQLGIGSTEHSAVPRQVPGLTGVKIVDVAAGSDHSLLLTCKSSSIHDTCHS
jgi:alpha-tubulin suppressor-like RCC1 family protein